MLRGVCESRFSSNLLFLFFITSPIEYTQRHIAKRYGSATTQNYDLDVFLYQLYSQSLSKKSDGCGNIARSLPPQ